jgi:hypothetical protein
MSQQINLYSPVFRKQKKYFSAAAMAYSTLLVLAGIGALSAYARVQVRGLEDQAKQATEQLRTTTEQLRAAVQDATGETRIKTLESRVKEADARLAERKQIIDALDQLGQARQHKYSEYLRAFARQSVDGVWLSSIRLDQAADGFSLSGRALRADMVPLYIDRLRREELLQGRGFDKLEVRIAGPSKEPGPAAAPSSLVEFQLRSGSVDETTAAPAKED